MGGRHSSCGHKHWVLRALTVANTSQLVHTGAADDTACAVGTIAIGFLGVKVVQPAGKSNHASQQAHLGGGRRGTTWASHPCNMPCSALKPLACSTHMYPAA